MCSAREKFNWQLRNYNLLSAHLTSMISTAELQVQRARKPLAALLKFLNLASSRTAFSQFTLEELKPDTLMKLDVAAVHALHLLPVNELVKEDTIFGILCRARTAGGQRLLSEWLKQPLLDVRKIGLSPLPPL